MLSNEEKEFYEIDECENKRHRNQINEMDRDYQMSNLRMLDKLSGEKITQRCENRRNQNKKKRNKEKDK